MTASPLMQFIKLCILMLTLEQPYSGLVQLFEMVECHLQDHSILQFCVFPILKHQKRELSDVLNQVF